MTKPSTTDPETGPAKRRRPDWVHATDGVFLIGLGVFALLNASGKLPWSFWYDALSLWPILLVSMGLRIAVERSRTPWLSLLGPVVVLTTLAALATGRLDAAPGPWQSVAVARPQGAETLTLRVKFASARVDVASRPVLAGLMVEGRQGSRESKARVATKQEGAEAKVTLDMQNRGWSSLLPGRISRWELGATDAMPVKVELDGVLIGGRFDFTRSQLEPSHFRGAFNGIDLRLPRPAAPVRIDVGGVFNAVDLYVPAGTPIRVHGPGYPFNIVDRGSGDPKDAANPGYEVHFGGVFSRVGVSELPTP